MSLNKMHRLLLGELEGGEQVDRLELAEVDVVAEEENEDELGDVLALGLAVNTLLVR